LNIGIWASACSPGKKEPRCLKTTRFNILKLLSYLNYFGLLALAAGALAAGFALAAGAVVAGVLAFGALAAGALAAGAVVVLVVVVFVVDVLVVVVFEVAVFAAGLLAVLLVAASPQAIPRALSARSDAVAMILVICCKFSCLSQRLSYL
jgi:hypothetical protein